MGTVRRTNTVTDLQDHWIKAQIEAGRYHPSDFGPHLSNLTGAQSGF